MKRTTRSGTGCAASVLILAAASLVAQQNQAVFPEGDGRGTFIELCGGCHDARDTIKTRRTRGEWQDMVADMQAKGAQGSPDDAREIAGYLSRAFGRVNVNKADADELVAVLGVTEAEAQAIVTWRITKQAFKTLDDLKAVTGVRPEPLVRAHAGIMFGDK